MRFLELLYFALALMLLCFDLEASTTQPLVLSITLDEAVQMGLERNRQIRDSIYLLESTKIGLNDAHDVFDIKIRPLSNINYSAGDESDITVWEVGGALSKQFQTGIGVELRPSLARGDEEYDAGIGFSIDVPLLKGKGREVTLNNVYSSEFAVANALRNHHQQQVTTILETITTIYRIIREQQLVELYSDQLEALRNHRRLVSVKERAGLARSMDVYRVEIRIKDVEDSLNLAIERGTNLLDRLKELLALSLDQDLTVQAPLTYSFISVDLEEAVDIALNNRVEIVQGKASISEAQRRTKLAYHNILPELDFQATYERKGRSAEFERMFVFDEDVFRIGLSSSTDLARSAEKSAWTQSKITLNREHLQFDATREDIIRELRQVINGLHKSEERIYLRREQITQAAGKQRLARVKFQHGEADNFDLIESQTQLQRAKANLVSDEIQYIIDSYRLRAAMGTLIEYNGI